MPTRFSAQGILLEDGKELAVHSAEFHYWRSDRKTWRAALTALKNIGLTMISSYVPWSVHETGAGNYDFKGPRDLKAFIDEVEGAGLYLLLRPGPHINAELTHFGFPERILSDSAMLARNARGTPVWLPAPPKFFPVPSYASGAFQAQVHDWFAAFANQVQSRMYPDGPLIALQVDNEMQMFWRLAAFDGDYHPDALKWWREFDDRPAPTEYRSDDMDRLLSWLRFKEHYVARSLGWLKDALVDTGLGDLARYHNLPPSRPGLCNAPDSALAIDGTVGMDMYDLASGYRRVRERALYLSSSMELPFAPEVGIGGPPWFPVMREGDQRNVLLGALAGGVRAFNLYMGVGRERWYGGLVDEAGETSPSAEWIAPLLATLRRCKFATLRRSAPIALVVSRAEERAALASCALPAATPCITDLINLGPGGHAELALDKSCREHARWTKLVQQALDLAELPYQLIDENSLHMLQPDTRAILLPTLRRVDGAVWAALHALAASGMQVIIGPDLPTHDELDRPLGSDSERPRGAGLLARESMADVHALAADLLDLAGELSDLWISPESPDAHCTVYVDGDDTPRLLFVGNQSPSPQLVLVNVLDTCLLEDGITGEKIRGEGGLAYVTLARHQVRVFLISGERH